MQRGMEIQCLFLLASEVPGPPPCSSNTFSKYVALIKQCTDPTPDSRPPFADILNALKALEVEEGAN